MIHTPPISRRRLGITLIALLCLMVLAPEVLASISPTIPPIASPPSRLLRLIGRFHPLMVHFPIALIITAAFLEVARRIRPPKLQSNTAHVCLTLGTIFAILAVGSGLANAETELHGQSMEQTLFWHRWLGISTAIGATATLLWATFFRNSTNTLRHRVHLGALALTTLILSITGHFGGTLVFGEGYILDALSKPDANAPRIQPADPGAGDHDSTDTSARDEQNAVLFASVQQILSDRCYECHGPSRQKANLRFDIIDEHWKDDQSFWVFDPGNADESEIVLRISRPVEERGKMPPRGDRLTNDQINTIKQWINAGGPVPIASAVQPSTNKAPSDANPGPTLTLSPSLPPLDTDVQVTPSDPQAVADAIKRLTQNGIIARPIAQDSHGIEVSFALLGKDITDDQLAQLAGLEDVLVWLNLARSAITDDGLATLARYPQLRRLHLEQTAITDAGLAHLAALQHLQYLNLYGTQITDVGLQSLHPLTSLRRLYLWKTAITQAGTTALQSALPEISILADTATPDKDN